MPDINAIQSPLHSRRFNEAGRSINRPEKSNATTTGEGDTKKDLKIERGAKGVLDKDAFLKLLLMQLSKQNPLEPVNDREFISQMAQFSSLEQMSNISKSMDGVAKSLDSMKSFQASFLIGKSVTGLDMLTGKPITGNVDRIIYDDKGEAFLRVESKSIRLKDVVSVEMTAENVSRETFQNLNQSAAKSAYGTGAPAIQIPSDTGKSVMTIEPLSNDTQQQVGTIKDKQENKSNTKGTLK